MTTPYTTALSAATEAAWERHAQAIRYSLPGGCGGYLQLVQQPLLMAELGFREAVREVVRELGGRHQEDQTGRPAMTTLEDPDPMIVAFTGRAGSGKDTAAAHLVRHYGFIRAGFADSLKTLAANHFSDRGVDYANLYEPHLKNVPIAQLHGVSAREYLQRVGGVHRDMHPDWWVHALRDELGLSNDPARRAPVHDRIVISDLRFPNEAAWLLSERATIIKLLRDGAAPVRPDESEAHVDGMPCHHAITNNGPTLYGLHMLLDGTMAAMGVDRPPPVEPEYA
jgi:hypothetical protein